MSLNSRVTVIGLIGRSCDHRSTGDRLTLRGFGSFLTFNPLETS